MTNSSFGYRAAKILLCSTLFSASSGLLFAIATAPTLKIAWVTETNFPPTLSPLGVASVPVIASLTNGSVAVPADGGQFSTSVICTNEPVLAIEITAQSGHTNEVEWSTDLGKWNPSHVLWIAGVSPVRQYIPQPSGARFYRVKEWNTPPVARAVVFPTTGGLYSLFPTNETAAVPRTDEPPSAARQGAGQWQTISPNNTNVEAVLQGSSSSDAENDPLQFFWDFGTNGPATTADIQNELALGNFVATLLVSDGIQTVEVNVSIQTLKASAAVGILSDRVRQDEEAILAPSDLHRLLATLQAAAAAFDRGQFISGVNQLESFENHVRVQMAPLTETSLKFLEAAQEIIHAVTNSGTAGGLRSSVTPGTDRALDASQTADNSTDILNSTGALNDAGAQSRSFDAATRSGCNWTAGVSQAWIHTTSVGSESGTATYAVDANSASTSRAGTITANGQALTLNQAGSAGCNVGLNPTNGSSGANSGSGSFGVAALTGCGWNATAGQIWIHTVSSGTGSGSVNYTVDANGSSSPRSGSIAVNNQIFNVNQAGSTAVDSVAPSATFLSPTNAAILSGPVLLQVRCADNLGLGHAEFYIDSAGSWTLLGTSPSTGAVYTNEFLFDSITQPNGAHTLLCMVFDGASNSAYAMQSVSISNVVPDPGVSLFFNNIALPTVASLGEAAGAAAKADDSGNVVVVGTWKGVVTFGTISKTSLGGTDIFVAKYDRTGNLLWVQTYGGTLNDVATSVGIDALGAVFVTGYFFGTANFGGTNMTSGTGASGSDAFVAKYAANGAPRWSKRLGGTYGNNLGAGIAVDRNGDAIVAGGYYGNIDLGAGLIPSRALSSDGFVVKLSGQSGAYLWSRDFGSSDTDTVKGVAVDSLGNLAVVGFSYAGIDFGSGAPINAGSSDVFIAKYAGADGRYLWSRTGAGPGPDSADGVGVDANQNILVTGGFLTNITLSGIKLTAIIDFGVFVAKYDSTGAIQWARGISPETAGGSIISRGAAADSAGNVAITGTASGGVDFGNRIPAYGEANIYVAKYNPMGAYLWAKRSANTGRCAGQGLTVDPDRNVFSTGFIQGDVTMDNLPASSPGTSIKSAFLYKVSP